MRTNDRKAQMNGIQCVKLAPIRHNACLGLDFSLRAAGVSPGDEII